jgi:multimeric flavodoxin WrbA
MKKLKILGISGSPRRGNSLFLLEEALKAAEEAAPGRVETETYTLMGKKFGPCLGCGKCVERAGACVIEDDFQELRDKWVESDAIIYSVAVYHMSIPGQLKCFLDRLGNSLFGFYLDELPEGVICLPKQLKPVGSIAQGCHIFSGQEHTITDLVNHALIMQCVPVVGDMWESYIGAGGWTLNENGRHALKEQHETGEFDAQVAVKASRDLGRRVAQIAFVIRDGVLANREMLEKDAVYVPYINRLDAKLGQDGTTR